MTATNDDVGRPPLDLRGKRVWVSGHRGMVGSALVRRLAREDCTLLFVDRAEVDLTSQAATEDWMRRERPEIVFAAAARVGGIIANATYPAEFLYENLMIGANVIHAAYRTGVEKLLYLGSSCIYPRDTAQPIREDQLLTGALEKTNEPYAIAKIAGVKMVECYARQYGCRFISAMPTNLYGPNDNFDLETSHVLPALIRRIHEAKIRGLASVEIWGSGRPRREFLHVDDLADACIIAMRQYEASTPINIGTGADISVAELAKVIAEVVGYQGTFAFDERRPDGTPRKLLDIERIAQLGWRSGIDLEGGIRDTYRWWLEQAPPRTDDDDCDDGHQQKPGPSGQASNALVFG
ncbi:GDP-L-fucose synthase [Mycobacterium sp. KBS0706]|uniref:GDP-L-fucose synthase family protein n=1 Tax=Mycobacterium sp. KBS0706 TaxID=2578109 RepID=UPI0027D25124|nr:GDP-L-fucose synthase [Mycobacterium sp. KBS0706]